MARPANLTPLPDHPALLPGEPVFMQMYGSSKPCVQVRCEVCGVVRWYPMSTLRQWMKTHAFTGRCKGCQVSDLEHRRRCITNRHGDRTGVGRRVRPGGYVEIRLALIADEDVPVFDALRGKAAYVLEHRWVMSKALGRALTRQENVDHMDGDKQNNDLSNLRIYRTGKNEAGSCTGYGTYYHEWQMALARIRELEGHDQPPIP